MKLGILTTHDSTNYGAVLQAYALYKVLSGLEYDVKLIDRRRNPHGEVLKRYLDEPMRKRIRRYFCFAGGWIDTIRRQRTIDFIRKNIPLTSYHFHDWKDAPDDLCLDGIVIGSDQVWNPKINDPLDYLPGRIPLAIPCVSYAASIGLNLSENEISDDVRKGLFKLKAISIREKSSIELIKTLGMKAENVIDPVALAGKECWEKFSKDKSVSVERKRIFVYSLQICDTMLLCEQVSKFAKKSGNIIDVFTGGLEFLELSSIRHPRKILKNIMYWIKLQSFKNVKMHLIGGPEQFLNSLLKADTVVTNSFHGMVFASIFGKNVRYILPTNNWMKSVMNRIYDYGDSIIEGPIWQSSLHDAFQSIANGERTQIKEDVLDAKRQKSLSWLKQALTLLKK